MDELEENMLKDRVEVLEEYIKIQSTKMGDLLEYLTRTDANFAMDPADFTDWRERLRDMRKQDEENDRIAKARHLLEQNGYIIAVNENHMDAAKVKAWVSSKPVLPDDDDIPF